MMISTGIIFEFNRSHICIVCVSHCIIGICPDEQLILDTMIIRSYMCVSHCIIIKPDIQIIGTTDICETNQELDAKLTASSITCACCVIDRKTTNTEHYQHFDWNPLLLYPWVCIVIIISRKVNWSICVLPALGKEWDNISQEYPVYNFNFLHLRQLSWCPKSGTTRQ